MQTYYVDIFNRGKIPFQCKVEPSEPWMIPGKRELEIVEGERITLDVKWEDAPEGLHRVPVRISGPGGTSVTVFARIDNRPLPSGKLV